jgi:type I restriction enzyme S subunit
MSVAASSTGPSWAVALLGELCDVNIGRTPARERSEFWGPGYPWLSIADMNQGRHLETTAETITEMAVRECNCHIVPAGTVLLSFKLSIGKVGIARRPLYTNEAIAALPIKASSWILPGFLYWALRTIDLTLGLDRAAKGLTLNKDKLVRVRVPLPPLPEQRRIAEILDKADELRAKRRAALAQLDTLSQSIFLHMFGDPAANPKGFPTSIIDGIAEQVTDGEHLTPERTTDGIKLLSARNIRDGYIDFENVDYIGIGEYERIKKRCNPSRGDVLISCSGTIGRVASVESDERFSLVRSAALVRPNNAAVRTKFLEHYLRTPALKARMLRRANASGQANLFQGQIRELPVYMPSLDLQDGFVRIVTRVASLKALDQGALADSDAMFASLQHLAFKGEL